MMNLRNLPQGFVSMQCRQEALRSDWYLNSIHSKKSKFQYLWDQKENPLEIFTNSLIQLIQFTVLKFSTVFYLNSATAGQK